MEETPTKILDKDGMLVFWKQNCTRVIQKENIRILE